MRPGPAGLQQISSDAANRRHRKGEVMTNPMDVLNAGLWLVFVVWAVALDLCREDRVNEDE